VLGPDGEPLYAPITDDRLELRSRGCSGAIRLEAVDADRKPLSVQAAYVELGNGDDSAQRNVAASGDKDLVRACFDSMTRTMESMQRAQVERERTLAQKEQALTEAQIASQKMTVELMIAILDRTSGARPQDALSVLKQQFEIQKVIERQQGLRRNAELPVPAVDVAQNGTAGVLGYVKAAAPMVLMAAQEFLVPMLAKDDPAKAEMFRRSIGTISNMLAASDGAASAAAVLAAPAPIEATQVRSTLPKVMREILALLDDAEAEAFEAQLAALDDQQLAAVCTQVSNAPSLDHRVAWARSVIQPVASAPTGVEIPGIPSQLVPVLMQLSSEEQMIGIQILSWLDRATTEKVTADLLSLPPEAALAKVRQMIDEARRRGPSVAQRAVASVFTSGKNGVGKNGAPNGGGQ
jgi:hypothetical protein